MPLCRKSWLWCWEQGFFTCWQLASCQSTQLWISLCWRLADRPIQGTNALPFPHCRLSAPFTYNIIQMQNLSIPVIIPPRCLFQLPLDSRFFLFIILAPQHKIWPAARHTRTEKVLSRLVASAFLALSYNATKKWQKERGKDGQREAVGAEGLRKHK